MNVDGHYRAVFDAAPDAVLIVDDRGRIADANTMAATMFGYASDELRGKPIEVLVPESGREKHMNARHEYQDSPHTRPMGIGLELRGRHREGHEFPVEVSLSPFTQDGRTFVIASARDISERKRIRALRTAVIKAAEAERARIARELHDDTAQRLAAAIIHLRLSGRVRGADRDEMDAALRKDLAEIAEGVRRIARGLRPPELEEVGLESAVASWSRTLTEDTSLRVRIEADAVDAELTDEERLVFYRVIQEALTNARRHSDAGAVTVTIASDDGRILTRVRDDGRGFDTETALAEANGLGLHGMIERATMIGAEIEIVSSPDQGTEVWMAVNRKQPPTPEE